jgi:hypothetical protein
VVGNIASNQRNTCVRSVVDGRKVALVNDGQETSREQEREAERAKCARQRMRLETSFSREEILETVKG